MNHPDFSFELKLWEKRYSVIGIDEVGYGALAGPIYVGLVYLKPIEDMVLIKEWLELGINDSKKISSKKRTELSKTIFKKVSLAKTAFIDVEYINQFGIVQARQKAIEDALMQLQPCIDVKNTHILTDAFPIRKLMELGFAGQTNIIRGDQQSIAIAAASIIAKVERDNHLISLSEKYKEYGWEANKGYGTQHHIQALKTFGKTSYHRDLYIRKVIASH